MNSNTSVRMKFAAYVLAFACCLACFSVGCSQDESAESSTADLSDSASGTKGLPKLNLHRPKTCADAVVRLKSLVKDIAGDGPFPEPLKLRVREVIHGTGAAAHSHYYLVDENGQQEEEEEDGHEHMESSEKFHDVEVPAYTETVDLAQWLPHLAADADINEATWNDIRSISKEIVNAMRSIEEKSSEEEKRMAFRENLSQFDGWISKLEQGLGMSSETAESGKD